MPTWDTTCSNYAFCCNASTFYFSFFQLNVYPLNVVLSLGVFLSSIFLLVKLLITVIRLNKQVSTERNYLINEIEEQVGDILPKYKPAQPLLPLYYGYLFIVSMWLLLQAVSLAMVKETFGILLVHLLQDGHAFIDNFIIIFAFFKVPDKKAVTFSLLICSIPTIIRAISTFIYSHESQCEYCSFYFPAPKASYIYIVSAIIYSIILLTIFFKTKIRPRDTVKMWVIYLDFIYFIGSVALILVYDFQVDFGICIVDFVSIIYVFTYSPILYFTIVIDSKFLSQELQEEHFLTTASQILENDRHNDNNNNNNNKNNKNIEIKDNNQEVKKLDNLKKLKNVQYNEFGRKERLELIIEDFDYKAEILDLLIEYPSITWIDVNEIQFGKRIGFGGFAEVCKGDWNGSRVAVKTLFHNNGSSLRSFFREVKMMTQLHHPNILLFMGICVDKKHRYIITELMSRGSAFDLIHSKKLAGQITGERIKRILVHSATGILYLHSINPPIIHRDLKSHNLLIDENWTVKVADFGLSRAKAKNTMTATGTPQWSAPEVIRKEIYSEKADVYSYGVIIYELLTGRIPYENMSAMDILTAVANYGLTPTFPKNIKPLCGEYIKLAKLCWNIDPDQRPSFADILEILSPLAPPKLSTPYIESEADDT